MLPEPWPVLTRYAGEHLRTIALPLGGIGTGTISLGGRGDLIDWEVGNRPNKGFAPRNAFFALWARPAGGEPVARALEGALLTPFGGATGARQPNHGLPRFREAAFEAAYPLGQVVLHDDAVPLNVRLQAFNPLIPGDSEASGLPVAILRWVLHNPTGSDVSAAVCGGFENCLGAMGAPPAQDIRNGNAWRDGDDLRGVALSTNLDPKAFGYGTLALATTASDVSHRLAWLQAGWGDSLLDFWEDFADDGALEPRDPGSTERPTASLAARVDVPAGATRSLTFLIAWHFPNRAGWKAKGEGETVGPDEWVGNHYCTRFADAWDAAAHAAARLDELETGTLAFVRGVVESDLPPVVKDAALSNLPALRSQTSFRTADGHFFGWEGCHDTAGCCPGSCTHVWNYEQSTAFLFGDLARSMREVEFLHATTDDGLMSFRVHLPLDKAAPQGRAAADGQMGCLMKLYREWRLSGDDTWLARLWPRAKAALAFAWIPGGWDGDADGVMEGCQHNTMDVEYYGPNPQMEGWYLGALRAAEAMARHLGDDAFASTCRERFEAGRAWTDEHLFNGEYYEHEIRPTEPVEIADGLKLHMGAQDPRDPRYQLGTGCLVDQHIGPLFARVVGLGDLLDREQVRASLQAIVRYNHKPSLWDHFNNMRTYALQDEAATLMAAYPHGERPRYPFPYFNEAMTGFEHTAAVHLLYEGDEANGLRLMRAVRDRHDGRRRNPFDEAECGHHYARAMVAWAGILALTGFQWSALDGTMTFRAADGEATWFWSNGGAWGTVKQQPRDDGVRVALHVERGELPVRRLVLDGVGKAAVDGPVGAGRSAVVTVAG